MRHFFLILWVVVGGLIGMPGLCEATLLVQNDFSTKRVGELVVVTVEVTTGEHTINALETNLHFSSDVLEFVSSNDNGSVISLWIEKPFLSGSGTISFSGIVPGGLMTTAAPVARLTFVVKKPGVATFKFADPVLLLNDGLGTPIDDPYQALNLFIGNGVVDNAPDTEMPEDFVPELASDPDVQGGRVMILFSTHDTGSGMHYFEVKQGRFGRYIRAESPYVIADQDISSVFYVKAVDNAGNERIKELNPTQEKPWYLAPTPVAVIVIIGIFLLYIFGYRYRRHCRR